MVSAAARLTGCLPRQQQHNTTFVTLVHAENCAVQAKNARKAAFEQHLLKQVVVAVLQEQGGTCLQSLFADKGQPAL